ncbi:MAG: phosphatidate cytidylyltransferase [Clostridia bacterium]|nr:phosphatidate cytidylyltransferase [Clostridia bacterium]
MLTRIITAIVALAVFVPILCFGGIWGAGILFAIICGFSIYEMLMCCGLHKKWILSVPSVLFSAFCALLPVMLHPHTLLIIGFTLAVIPMVLICFLFYGVVAHKTVPIERLMMFFALAIYITAGFASLSLLRAFYGIWIVVLVLCVSWFTDTFAYFGGLLFGKKKLCPEISPKKTVAGAISGTLFGTVAGIVVSYLFTKTIMWGLFALPLSIISQFGDLSASIVKRHFGVKDYGKIFPGHGGILDRFDSIIPTSVVMAVIIVAIETYAWLF